VHAKKCAQSAALDRVYKASPERERERVDPTYDPNVLPYKLHNENKASSIYW